MRRAASASEIALGAIGRVNGIVVGQTSRSRLQIRVIMQSSIVWLSAISAAAYGSPATAQDTIIVTATRTPESEVATPVAESAIAGRSIPALGPIDLRVAVSPAAGIEVTSGSDAGPAGSVVAAEGLAGVG